MKKIRSLIVLFLTISGTIHAGKIRFVNETGVSVAIKYSLFYKRQLYQEKELINYRKILAPRGDYVNLGDIDEVAIIAVQEWKVLFGQERFLSQEKVIFDQKQHTELIKELEKGKTGDVILSLTMERSYFGYPTWKLKTTWVDALPKVKLPPNLFGAFPLVEAKKNAGWQIDQKNRAIVAMLGYMKLPLDYYILGIPKENLKLTELEKAYKELILKWHPDKHLKNPSLASEISTELNTAYQNLIDALTKAELPTSKNPFDAFPLVKAKTDAGWQIDVINREIKDPEGIFKEQLDYLILGVSENVTKAELENIYKKFMLQWHPDKHPQDPALATEISKIVNAAYDNLQKTKK